MSISRTTDGVYGSLPGRAERPRSLALLVVVALVMCVVTTQETPEVRADAPEPGDVVHIAWTTGEGPGAITSWGSGALVVHDGKQLILTAAHIIDREGGRLVLHQEDGDVIPCTVEKTIVDKGCDMAVFVVSGLTGVKPWTIGRLSVGDSVIALGYPGTEPLKAVEGKLIKTSRTTDCQIEGGMSGGPLMQGGCIVGINSSIVRMTNFRGAEHTDVWDAIALYEKSK